MCPHNFSSGSQTAQGKFPYLSIKYTDIGPTPISKNFCQLLNIENTPMLFLGELTVILIAAVSILTESSAA